MTLGLLIIRVIAGLTMAAHGGQKLFGWFDGPGRRGTAGMMDNLGYREPAIMASVAGLAELAGGLGLALGFLTPFAAIAIVVVMLNATFAVHLKNGFWNTASGYEYPLVMSAVAVGIAATGPVTRRRTTPSASWARSRVTSGRSSWWSSRWSHSP
jgi:putative oxidoreductase